MLAASDEYMHERAHDVDDVMNRIIRNIQDQKLFSRLEGESIIVSETLAPADTVIFSRNQILGYATDLGGVTSHAAHPLPVAQDPRRRRPAHRHQTDRQTGDTIAIDGYAGVVVIHPSDETTRSSSAGRRSGSGNSRNAWWTSSGLDAETLDHTASGTLREHRIRGGDRVRATAGRRRHRPVPHREPADRRGAYYPRRREQYQTYAHDRRDDLPAPGHLPHVRRRRRQDRPRTRRTEQNPFLGWRGIRVLLDQPGPLPGPAPGDAPRQQSAERPHHVPHGLDTAGGPGRPGVRARRRRRSSRRQGIPFDAEHQDRRDDRGPLPPR